MKSNACCSENKQEDGIHFLAFQTYDKHKDYKLWLSDLLLSLRVQDDEAENFLLYFNFGIVVDERVAANEERDAISGYFSFSAEP